MNRFAQLFAELDAQTATNAKVEALKRYFVEAPAEDAAWGAYFLAGGKPRQAVPTRLLREMAVRAAQLDDWLFEECYQAVGDLAETIAHVWPAALETEDIGLARWVEERLIPLRGLPPEEIEARFIQWMTRLDWSSRFLLIKLIGGGFRVGVSRLLVTRAIAEAAGQDAKLVAQRMMGYTDAKHAPTAARFAALTAPPSEGEHQHGGTPYPFFLAHPLQAGAETLGDVQAWQAEWKYDGIRAQLVRRNGETWLWSRGEELISERFPEIIAASAALSDGTVLDGELLIWHEGESAPASFAQLQTRITRKTVSRSLMSKTPAVFVAYDLLELERRDLRNEALRVRRNALETLVPQRFPAGSQIRIAPLVTSPDWHGLMQLRTESRARGVEGLMLKSRDAAYGIGRTKEAGVWWKWKIDPLTIDAVLIYAQAGHGRRASLYTDYTFAVWQRAPKDAEEAAAALAVPPQEAQARGLPTLTPFAKAYSGLTDEEFKRVDAVIRKTTIDKFGPVRSVLPSLVFELGFEGIAASPRHKSGIAVRFPRMLRIRDDKPLHEADTLASLQALLSR
jgi:DNA ligase 1